jgi:hypothetical protein
LKHNPKQKYTRESLKEFTNDYVRLEIIGAVELEDINTRALFSYIDYRRDGKCLYWYAFFH